MGAIIPVAALQVLFALCSSLSSAEGSASTIIGHLSDPEATVSAMVRIVQHPYDDALLRNAVWNFITLAVDKEPALARLFVTGQFRMPSVKGKEKAEDPGAASKNVSALSVACETLEEWKELWESNPKLLASLLRFLDVVWQHGHEHKMALDPIRKTRSFLNTWVGSSRKSSGLCRTAARIATSSRTAWRIRTIMKQSRSTRIAAPSSPTQLISWQRISEHTSSPSAAIPPLPAKTNLLATWQSRERSGRRIRSSN